MEVSPPSMSSYSARATTQPMQETDVALMEMELLEQNQRRLGNLTSRMTTILNGFDRRLIRLESSILPIHKSTQLLSRIHGNVEAVQRHLEQHIRHYGIEIQDEPFLRQGPDPQNPWAYMEAIQRVVNDATPAQGAHADDVLSKRKAIVDMAARKLVQLVQQYAVSEPIDPRSYLASQMPHLSGECLTSIKALIQFLYTLSDTQSKSDNTFRLALKSLARVRASYLTSSMQSLTHAVVQAADHVQSQPSDMPREAHVKYVCGAAPFSEWLRALVMMMESEQAAVSSLFQGMSWKALLGSTLSHIFQPIVTNINTLLPRILPRLQHGLQAHRFLALDFVRASRAALGPSCEIWNGVLQHTKCSSTELSSAVISSQKDAILFFPELLRDIKVIPVQREHEALHADVSDIARYGIRLLRDLTDYQDILTVLLTSMGTKNWTSDASDVSALADGLWAEYARDMLASIVSSLERAVAGSSQPMIASIFLLNNYTFLHTELRSMSLIPGAMSACDQVLSRGLRTARVSYLETWKGIIQPLQTEPSLVHTSSTRQHTVRTDPIQVFFGLLQKMEQVHHTHPLVPGITASVRDDVIQIVMPLYVTALAKRPADAGVRMPTDTDILRMIEHMYAS